MYIHKMCLTASLTGLFLSYFIWNSASYIDRKQGNFECKYKVTFFGILWTCAPEINFTSCNSSKSNILKCWALFFLVGCTQNVGFFPKIVCINCFPPKVFSVSKSPPALRKLLVWDVLDQMPSQSLLTLNVLRFYFKASQVLTENSIPLDTVAHKKVSRISTINAWKVSC